MRTIRGVNVRNTLKRLSNEKNLLKYWYYQLKRDVYYNVQQRYIPIETDRVHRAYLEHNPLLITTCSSILKSRDSTEGNDDTMGKPMNHLLKLVKSHTTAASVSWTKSHLRVA